MSALVQRFKEGPIELSDSDSDRLTIEESTCDEDKWIRRSTRVRKTSTRFYDFFTGDEEPTTSSAAPKNVKNRHDAVKISPKLEPSNDIPELSGTELDPAVLVGLVEKNKMTIQPGQYSVRLPAGPDQFVSLDATEYLLGLGYYNSLIEEEIMETKPSPWSKDDAKAAANKNVESEYDDVREQLRKRAVPKPKTAYRIKEVDEPDQFSSASAYSTDEEESEGPEIIDVTGCSPPRKSHDRGAVKRRLKVPETGSKSRMWDKDYHNQKERERRDQMAKKFDYLRECIVHQRPSEFLPPKSSKVRILTEALKAIDSLLRETQILVERMTREVSNNKLLRARYDALTSKLNAAPKRAKKSVKGVAVAKKAKTD